MNKVTLGIIVGAILASFGLYIAYQNAVVIPRERIEAQERAEDAKRLAEEMERSEREQNYSRCLQQAWIVYSQNWDGLCEINGLEKDCTLPRYRANELDDDYADEKDRCVTMYK